MQSSHPERPIGWRPFEQARRPDSIAVAQPGMQRVSASAPTDRRRKLVTRRRTSAVQGQCRRPHRGSVLRLATRPKSQPCGPDAGGFRRQCRKSAAQRAYAASTSPLSSARIRSLNVFRVSLILRPHEGSSRRHAQRRSASHRLRAPRLQYTRRQAREPHLLRCHRRHKPDPATLQTRPPRRPPSPPPPFARPKRRERRGAR